ncbi:hypothetical protein ACOMHN_013816 [Nucella lapillus]
MGGRPTTSSCTWCVNLVSATLLLPLALALSPCPEVVSPVLSDKVARSQVVVQGQVRREVRVKDGSYGAEVEVQCVFKGGPVSSVINVIVDGHDGGERCVPADLPKERNYLIYLNRREGEGANSYTPTFSQDPAERKYLDELQFSCGLQVQLPSGVTESIVCKPERFVMPDYELDCPDTAPSGSPPVETHISVVGLSLACLLLPLLW